MAMNRFQFQPNWSMPGCDKSCGTEALCSDAQEGAHWIEGFRCSVCVGAAQCILHSSGDKVFQRNACWHQTSPISGKSRLRGSFHSYGSRKYAAQCLGAFAFPFNRRFDLKSLGSLLLVPAAQCGPHWHGSIRGLAEVHS